MFLTSTSNTPVPPKNADILYLICYKLYWGRERGGKKLAIFPLEVFYHGLQGVTALESQCGRARVPSNGIYNDGWYYQLTPWYFMAKTEK